MDSNTDPNIQQSSLSPVVPDNEAQSVTSASPLGTQAISSVLPYEPLSIINPVSKSLKWAYLGLIPLGLILSVMSSLLEGSNNSLSSDNNVTVTVTILLTGLGLLCVCVTLYTFTQQLLAIKSFKQNAFAAFLFPPLICGFMLLVGIVGGVVWAVGEFGDRSNDAVGFIQFGVIWAVLNTLLLMYIFGIAEILLGEF